jgi:hypothetical protein
VSSMSSSLTRSTTSTQRRPLDTALFVLVIVAVAFSAQIAIGISVQTVLGDWGFAGFFWAVGVLTCTGSLAVGLWARQTRPVLSTLLLSVGALAPSLAFFWLPPVYLVSLAIIVLAVLTRPKRHAASTAR